MNESQITLAYQIGEIVTNLAIITVGVKLVRHITKIEFKVDIMWRRFERLFDVREEDREKITSIRSTKRRATDK